MTMHTSELLLRRVWLLWCCFMVIGALVEGWIVWHDPGGYYFGGQGPIAGLWYYASAQAYGTMLALVGGWYSAGALLCFRKGVVARVLLIVHAALSMLLLLVAMSPEG